MIVRTGNPAKYPRIFLPIFRFKPKTVLTGLDYTTL